MARNWDPSNKKVKALAFGTSLVASCLSSQVFAAGFQLLEQNVTNLGLAYSGTAALAEDASTVFFNPAGLTRLGESEVVMAGFVIYADNNITLDQTTPSIPIPQLNNFPVNGGQVSLDKASPVGAFYLSKRLDQKWVLGFGVSTPFGLVTEYNENSHMRYMATRSKLETFDLTPCLAYQATPTVSVGVGADAVYTKAVLETQVGWGDPLYDGFQHNMAEGWDMSWHAGILWQPTYRTRVGACFRAPINVSAEGHAEIQAPLNPPGLPVFPAPGLYSLQTVRAQVTLPDITTVSLYHQFNKCMAVTADFAWTNWSKFHTLRLRYEPGLPNGIDSDTWEHWRDTRRFALGLIYDRNQRWTWRAGVAYDQSPVRTEFRTARIPDSARTWLAAGAAYSLNKCLKVDVGYAFLILDEARLEEEAPFRAQTNQPISFASAKGTYEHPYSHIGGVQIRYDFV